MKNSIAIITARGGSKRIPKKNIRSFCGKPIIAYSVEAALRSKSFDEVMVSTDSEEIAEVAKRYGARVPFLRGERTSGDHAVTADVIEETLAEYGKRDRRFDSFCCIYPTAPFITADRIVEAAEKFERSGADSVVAVTQYSFPPQRAFVIRDGRIRFQRPEYERVRSQDLEKIYHDCGQFYICRTEPFQVFHSLVMPDSVPYVMPEDEAQDIDTETDWRLAEMKFINCQYKKGNDMDGQNSFLKALGGCREIED